MTTTTVLPLPRRQDTNCWHGVNPVESDPARVALVEAYRGLLDALKAANDVKTIEQIRKAIVAIEDNMSPNLLVTVLPAYSKVRFATDQCPPGKVSEGIVRDGAWGLYPDRAGATDRRITTDGLEFFANRETVFTFFEVIERG